MKEACIVIAGDKFDPAVHVVQKVRELKRYASNVRLTVFTDQPDKLASYNYDIRITKLPDWNLHGMRQLWWYKIYQFAPFHDWRGPVLYMDLDTVVLRNIDRFWDLAGEFCICQDFNRQFIPHYHVSNSSIMRWRSTAATHSIYTNFIQHKDSILKQYRGDQDYITAWHKDQATEHLTWWPREWAMSYKWELKHGGSKQGGLNLRYPEDYVHPEHAEVVPDDCSIAVFHGKPDPFDTEFGKRYQL